MKRTISVAVLFLAAVAFAGCVIVPTSGSCYGAPACKPPSGACNSSTDCCGSGTCTNGFCSSDSVLGSGCSCQNSSQCSGLLVCTSGSCR